MLVGVRRIFESVCLSVCLFVGSIAQKRMIPKCSNMVQRIKSDQIKNTFVKRRMSQANQRRIVAETRQSVRMTLEYTRSGILLGLKVKGQGRRVNRSILHTRTAIRLHSLGGITSCLRLRGCLVRALLTFARWRNQLSAWSRTL